MGLIGQALGMNSGGGGDSRKVPSQIVYTENTSVDPSTGDITDTVEEWYQESGAYTILKYEVILDMNLNVKRIVLPDASTIVLEGF